jgi:hypothetical protein
MNTVNLPDWRRMSNAFFAQKIDFARREWH